MRRCTGELDTSSNSRFTSLFREDHCGQVLGHPLDGVGMLIGEGRGVDQLLRLGENLKQQRAGCAEVPFHDKFLFPNTRAQRLVIKHWCPHFGSFCVARWPAIPAGSRPGDRSVLPTGDEKIVARTPTPGMAHASAYKFSGWPAAGPPQCQSRSEP